MSMDKHALLWLIGGSFENIVLQTFVDRLNLRVRKQHRPHFIRCLSNGDEVQVMHMYQVTFAIGEDYKDTV